MALTFAALIFSHIYLYLYDTVKAALERSQFSRVPNEEFQNFHQETMWFFGTPSLFGNPDGKQKSQDVEPGLALCPEVQLQWAGGVSNGRCRG